MESLGVLTWNMRGASVEGNNKKKVELLQILAETCPPMFSTPNLPVLMLQETGNLVNFLGPWFTTNYHICFSKPIGAKNDRCTTGLLIPKAYQISVDFDTASQESDTRSFITAGIDINGKTILLGSIHAVASGSAAEDDRAYLAACAKHEYFVCGGDYNCDPGDMESWNQFTERQAGQGCYYNVERINDSTHRTESTGKERVLDYVCVKNLTAGPKGKLFNSKSRAEAPYSDHWPIFYRIDVD